MPTRDRGDELRDTMAEGSSAKLTGNTHSEDGVSGGVLVPMFEADGINGIDVYFVEQYRLARERRVDYIEGMDHRFTQSHLLRQENRASHRFSSIVAAGTLALTAYAVTGKKPVLKKITTLGAAVFGGISSYAIFQAENKGDI